LVLSPREKIKFSGATGSLSFVPFRSDEVLWKDGILVFKDADLESFIYSVENWYGVDISVIGNHQSNWHINGRFENESLELILESLRFTENIEYAINNKKVLLII
jgi:ferric-dicitrate binding protein FerR (iron transport regulator)